MTGEAEFDTTLVPRFAKGKFMKAIYAAMIFAATCSAASAGEWSSQDDKGLKVYSLHDGAVAVDLVCDPDSLWEPPEYHLVVKHGGAVLDGESVRVQKGDEAVTLPMAGGSILSTDRDGWNKVIELVSEPGTIEFQAAGQAVAIEAESGLVSECKR